MTERPTLPPEVAERLGPFYVYVLVDPRTDRPFYVGKGTGQRLLAHGIEADLGGEIRTDSAKLRQIRDIRTGAVEPRIDIVRHGLSEDEAFLVEAALIDCLDDLTNAVVGHGSERDRRSIVEYATIYGADPVPSDAPPAVLIRLSRWTELQEELEPGVWRGGSGYRPAMTQVELADTTRAWWKISADRVTRDGFTYAVSVFEGVTRAVMEIGDWTQRTDGRRAFTATPILSGAVHEAWVGQFGRRVNFASNSQNPITYWPTS